MKHQNKQSGMTLLELMIAITIFAIITAAVFSLYINSNRSYNEDEIFARMQENGRFALNRMAQDIGMVDFWGEMINPPSTALDPADWGEDCTMGLDTPSTTASPALQYYVWGSAGTFDPDDCSALGDIMDGSNALAIKRVANGPALTAADYDGTNVYLETNGSDGTFVQANSPSGTAGYSNWLYQPNLYFIKASGDTPYLCRAGTDPAVQGTELKTVGDAEDDCLAEGVEQLHIEFGIDTDGDGVANRYRSDTTTDAVTARIYLLLSSGREVPGYENNKTYQLGSLGPLGPYGDSLFRRVFSTTVVLRNPRAYILLQ